MDMQVWLCDSEERKELKDERDHFIFLRKR